jgi:hypothetical protein
LRGEEEDAYEEPVRGLPGIKQIDRDKMDSATREERNRAIMTFVGGVRMQPFMEFRANAKGQCQEYRSNQERREADPNDRLFPWVQVHHWRRVRSNSSSGHPFLQTICINFWELLQPNRN